VSGLDRRFEIRCSAAQLERWTRLAAAAELSLGAWARNALDDTAAVQAIILADEARLRGAARRLHAMHPSDARVILERNPNWPDPPSHEGGEQR
jgi:hypothetical protein